MTFDDVAALAENGLDKDRHGHRNGFLELVDQARGVKPVAIRRGG